MQHSKLFLRLWLTVSLLLSLFFSNNVFALTCKTNGGEIKQLVVLTQPINISTANINNGSLLWRSETFETTFNCYDTNNEPDGEYAYLYWDPTGSMQGISNAIEVGVTYEGSDIKPVKNSKTNIGYGTICRPDSYGKCQSPARFNTLTIRYSIYIRATGNNPSGSNGNIGSPQQYAIFQVDGERGLNTTPDSNFRVYIEGLNNIKFIACKPDITVSANNGSVVDFGTIMSSSAITDKIEKQVPFTVRADLTGDGQDCVGQTLMVSFSPTGNKLDQNTIIPNNENGVGILISREDNPGKFLLFNTPTELGYINGSVVNNNFLASLKWLTNNPKIGTFNASANVDVTFK